MRSTSLPQVRFLTAIGILSLSAGLFMTQPAFSASPELIAREHIFGNPSRTSPQLNADGSLLAFLAPREGVMNLWVCPTGKFDEAKALTAEKKRPLSAYFWSANGEDILYIQDSGGDENFLLYGVNAKTGTTRKLTDFSKTRVNFYGTSWIRSDEVVIGLNNRDPKWHDAWLLNIKTGALTLLHENTERLSGYVVDDGLRLQYAVRTRPDGGWELLKFGSDGKALQVSATVEYEDADNTSLVGLTQDGTTLYLRDSRGRDKAVLKAIAIDSGKETILAEDSRVDISGAFRHPVTGRAEAYRVNYLRSEWHVLDKSRTADFEFLTQQFQNEWTPVSVTKDTRLWIIVRGDATTPGAFFLYDRQAKTVTKLFTSRPDLEGKPLVPMHPVEIKSRDGLTLVSYLTLPISADSNGDGKPEQKAPLVLLVHGGPWARDAYGFNGMHQWLANRGYAVLSVNFRGSTGFGKAFIRASDKEWAGKMHNDLLDAVDWAVKGGIAPKDKIAIMGGSYGGYATLVGLSFTPDVFACGVDIVGPANLQTLLSTIPPYWEAGRARFARAIGDVDTEEGRALLAARSPLTRASSIKKPLLIGQGANDPRVKQAESDQIVAAMKAQSIPVTYALYPDEGHGFARPENSLSFFAIVEGFLAQHLGGLAQPIGNDFKGSSLQVLHGAEQIPDLSQALASAAKQ